MDKLPVPVPFVMNSASQSPLIIDFAMNIDCNISSLVVPNKFCNSSPYSSRIKFLTAKGKICANAFDGYSFSNSILILDFCPAKKWFFI